jgi:DNA-binding CsgD family transcriptional regulator
MPLLLLTPFYHGLGNRWIVVPLFLLTLTAAGMFYGYLRLTTNSVWPAALAHSSFNAFWNLFSRLTIAVSPLALEYLAGEEVLRLIADGRSNADIAVRLVLSEKTVKGHVSNMLSKLQLADRTQAAIFAWRGGIARRD